MAPPTLTRLSSTDGVSSGQQEVQALHLNKMKEPAPHIFTQHTSVFVQSLNCSDSRTSFCLLSTLTALLAHIKPFFYEVLRQLITTLLTFDEV